MKDRFDPIKFELKLWSSDKKQLKPLLDYLYERECFNYEFWVEDDEIYLNIEGSWRTNLMDFYNVLPEEKFD